MKQQHTYRADDENEEDRKDMNRNIVRASPTSCPTSRLDCASIFLPAPQLCLKTLDGDVSQVWKRLTLVLHQYSSWTASTAGKGGFYTISMQHLFLLFPAERCAVLSNYQVAVSTREFCSISLGRSRLPDINIVMFWLGRGCRILWIFAHW